MTKPNFRIQGNQTGTVTYETAIEHLTYLTISNETGIEDKSMQILPIFASANHTYRNTLDHAPLPTPNGSFRFFLGSPLLAGGSAFRNRCFGTDGSLPVPGHPSPQTELEQRPDRTAAATAQSRLPRQNPAPRPLGIGKGVWLARLSPEPAQPASLPANRKRCRNGPMARQGRRKAIQQPGSRRQIRRPMPDFATPQPILPQPGRSHRTQKPLRLPFPQPCLRQHLQARLHTAFFRRRTARSPGKRHHRPPGLRLGRRGSRQAAFAPKLRLRRSRPPGFALEEIHPRQQPAGTGKEH